MGLGDMLDDCKTESGPPQAAAARLIDPVKPFEQPVEMFLGDPAAEILYPDGELVIELSHLDHHAALHLAVLDGVGQQVDDCLLQQRRVNPRLQLLGTEYLQVDLMLQEETLTSIPCTLQDAQQPDTAHLPPLSLFDPREIEQVFDQGVEPLDLLENDLQEPG